MRLFIALDIDEAIRERITRFVDGVTGFAPDARWMKPESLHVTLKFIGEQPESAVEPIKNALRPIAIEPAEIHFRGWILSHCKIPARLLEWHRRRPSTGHI